MKKLEQGEFSCCQEIRVHPDAVERVRRQLPEDEVLYDLAELCVCDIAKLLEVSQSAVSHQLRVLKTSKLVKFRREGKTVYYSLADDHVSRILSQGMEHITE